MNGFSQSIVTEATIIDHFGDDKYLVELPENGHQLIGHLPLKLSKMAPDINKGDFVRLDMTPYDLNKGKIIKKLPGFDRNNKFSD